MHHITGASEITIDLSYTLAGALYLVGNEVAILPGYYPAFCAKWRSAFELAAQILPKQLPHFGVVFSDGQANGIQNAAQCALKKQLNLLQMQ